MLVIASHANDKLCATAHVKIEGGVCLLVYLDTMYVYKVGMYLPMCTSPRHEQHQSTLDHITSTHPKKNNQKSPRQSSLLISSFLSPILYSGTPST